MINMGGCRRLFLTIIGITIIGTAGLLYLGIGHGICSSYQDAAVRCFQLTKKPITTETVPHSQLMNMSQIMLERKARLQSICSMYPPYTKMGKPHVGMLQDEKHKLLYCVVSKVGTSSILLSLLQANGFQLGQKHYATVHSGKTLNKYGIRHAQYSQSQNEFFKFFFVRHPMTRLVSAFRDKIARDQDFRFKKVQEAILAKRMNNSSKPMSEGKHGRVFLYKTKAAENVRRKYEPFVSNVSRNESIYFREFVEYVITDNAEDSHWRNYDKACDPCRISYDFIGHIENSEVEFPSLLWQAYRINKTSNLNVGQTAKRSHNTGSSFDVTRSYLAMLDPMQRYELRKIYQKDMDMFDYKWTDVV